MAEADTRYLSEVLSDARDNDLSTWLCHVTIADLGPHLPGPPSITIKPALGVATVGDIMVGMHIAVKWSKEVEDASFMFGLVTAVRPAMWKKRVLTKQVCLDIEHAEECNGSHVTKGFHVETKKHGTNWCVYEVTPGASSSGALLTAAATPTPGE